LRRFGNAAKSILSFKLEHAMKSGCFRVGASLLALLVLAGCETASPPETAAANPEPGLSGAAISETLDMAVLPQPFYSGVRLVGHAPLLERSGNIQMTWMDECAYVSTGAANSAVGNGTPETRGVAVIDVSNPRAPSLVRLLRDRGALGASESLHAVTAPGRKVLVAGPYGGTPGNAWIDIYDVSDCANPRLTAEVSWPAEVHTITLSPNGRRVYGTQIEPFSGGGGVHVLDIADMARPRYVGKFAATAPDGRSWEFAPHNLSLSLDERRMYVGVIGSRGGDLNRDFTSPDGQFSMERISRDAGGLYVFDNSDIASARPDPKLRLIGSLEDAGWHDHAQANINGAPYLIGSGELGACPGTWPRIISIADETRPVRVGEFRLDLNRAENCLPPSAPPAGAGQMAAFMSMLGKASVHYNSVDSATHTRLGLFSMMGAGLRIADLRDPTNPAEIAYFRPGDFCTGFVRYVPRSGHIWFTCLDSGFWVVELNPEVRASLGR
jgi:hypothetical protein